MLSNNLKVIDKLDSILNIFNFPAFSKDFELEFDKEKVFGEITEKVEETRVFLSTVTLVQNKIMKIYNEKFDVSWSRASKRKYEKLSRIGVRFCVSYMLIGEIYYGTRFHFIISFYIGDNNFEFIKVVTFYLMYPVFLLNESTKV